ncbi:MAG TPA: hypothetical protein VGG75_18490 [Trebonia sp.]|jgi:hypothetical protein
MNAEREALDAAARQRAILAERVRLPWWFVTVCGLALLGMFGLPVIGRWAGWTVSAWAVQVPCWLVLAYGQRALTRWRGVRISGKTLAAYPSTRAAGVTMLVVSVCAIIAIDVLAREGAVLPAAVLAAVAAAAGTVMMARMNAAAEADIRDGRTRSS